jgi:hypothetical protein
LTAASIAATVACVLGAWALGLPFERAALLAPVLVFGVGAVIGLFVFWGRVGLGSLRTSRHPRLILGLSAAFVGVFVVLALLGVNLPRE